MRDRSISLVALLLAGLAGCGEVDNGVCAGEQDDMVECTVDLCNANGAQWAHIADHGRCGAGERCDVTAGCVAAGALTGRAFLYAYTDHSGITVTIDGIEGASTTTDAEGNWSLGALPTGTHSITYSKDKFISQQQTGVAVFAEAASSPPSVELRHGNDLGVDQEIDWAIAGDSYNGAFLSPDKKHVVVRYNHYYQGTEYRAYKLDGLPSAPVPVFHDSYPYNPLIPFHVTNTHVVWTVQNQTVWSRPLDGGPPVILGSVVGNDSLGVMGTPGPYVVLRRVRDTGVFDESSLYVVNVDGSTPMSTPVYVQPDAQHQLAWLVNNDATALFGVNNTTANPPVDGQANTPLHRIDFATSALTNVNTAFATNVSGVFSVSPDGSYVFGYVRQHAPNNWTRGFLIPMSGTAGPALAPDYGAAATMYSDYANGTPVWFDDNSGVVYSTFAYSTFEGHLKVWATGRATSNQLVASGGYASWSVHNKVVVYRDSGSVVAPLRVVSAHSATPVSYPLDTQGNYVQDIAFDDVAGSSYIVWTQSVSAASPTRAKIFSALMPDPLIAAPTTVQLGGTLAAACQYEAVLSDRTYWQLCRDTGTLSGFSQSTTAAATTTPMVRPDLIALPDGDSVAYRRFDGKLYSSPNMGTLSDVRLLSAQWDGSSPLKSAGSWIFFNDANGGYLRASNASGTGIDEPLTNCRHPVQSYSGTPTVFIDPDKTHVFFNQLQCSGTLFGEFAVPTANLP